MKWLTLCFYCAVAFCGSKDPGFDSAMRTHISYRHAHRSFPVEWNRMKGLYENYRKAKKKAHLRKMSYRIPKRIHMIWLGSPLPEFSQRMLQTWKDNHPGWDVRLWTDSDVSTLRMRNGGAYRIARNWGEKSDILRYEILSQFGGIYVDADFECIGPFDDICKMVDFVTGLAYASGPPDLYNGLIGCRPHHPIIERCNASLRAGNGDSSFGRILETTGPLFFTRCFNETLWPTAGQPVPSDLGVVVAFPVTYFYALPAGEQDRYTDTELAKRDWLHPWSKAFHYYKVSWQKSG